MRFSDWCRDSMRMQVATSLTMDKPNDIPIANESEISSGIIVGFLSIRIDKPIIVRIFVMVTSDLLLHRSFREGLDMGVQESASISHVLQSYTRSKCKLKRTISTDLGASQVGLKE